MTCEIQDQHLKQPAYVYIRQSTMAQVRHHQESTERQYALREKAIELGWAAPMVRVLDADLGQSGAQMATREDFKTLVADVSMDKVGAVLALEASRLARSCTDWHRLLELASLTGTLIIDEDGCYDPADFNDQLLLGLKGTMSQAELHFLRARLLGGKLNKAKKGELRFPLPVGYCYGDEGRIDFDADEQVRAAVQMLFDTFRQTGSAYGVVHRFSRAGMEFPKRAYGGVWAGKLIWGRLTHARVLGVLKNPSYTGTYVFGRYRYKRSISPDGAIHCKMMAMPMSDWSVTIKDHHPRYIDWEQFLDNQQALERNRTNTESMLLSGAAREGLALLQGMLLCHACGRRLVTRYAGNGGIYPIYECSWRRREGISGKSCVFVRCNLVDEAVVDRVLEVLKPAQIDIAIKSLAELQKRDTAMNKQWQLRIERAEYEAQLAQRRYEEVDPSNRLVAATLEERWNVALVNLEQIKQEHERCRQSEALAVTPEQKARIQRLAEDLPRLWNAPTTAAKDRKRILRLLIKDVTVEKAELDRQIRLHVRWQGGACEDMTVTPPPSIADRLRYGDELLGRVRELAVDKNLDDSAIAATMNQEGRRSAKGKRFTTSMVKWIRFRYEIPATRLQRSDELTVKEVADQFEVSSHVVYYWIGKGILNARRANRGSPCWITLDAQKEEELRRWVENSPKLQKHCRSHSERLQ